jgi:hypothetical protein
MEIEVLRFRITVDYTGYPDMVAPRFIVCYLEDSDNSIVVNIRDGSDNYVSTPVSGPGLFLGVDGSADRLTPAPFYQFCESTTLRKIGQINTFPYCQLSSYPNDLACAIVTVCDLEISNVYTVVDSSGPAVADGEVTVTGTSSNGVIKYSMQENFDYTTSGNTTGIFTGLIAGTYIVYAKDEAGCYDFVYVTIPVTTEYAVRHRAEYDTVNGYTTRIDIHERGFEGDMDEICMGDVPFVLTYQDSDRYKTFISSDATLKLLEETEGQFSHLFTDDGRKYLIKFYKYISSVWVLHWTGYIVPAFYQQAFVRSTNNYLEITASDQIGDFKKKPFVDTHNNPFRGDTLQLTAILEILKKTGLYLNVRSADNIFETDMNNTGSDDPLDQTYFDPRIFYVNAVPRKCDDVLDKLIQVKSGLRLFQSEGYWWLVRSEINVGSFDYREFDIEGTFVTNDTFNPAVNRIIPTSDNGVIWRDESQTKIYDQNYGYFTVVQNLAFDDNLIDEGSFEEEYVVDLGSGNKGFKNWNVFAAQAGLRYGLEFVENKDSKGAFFMDFSAVTATQADNILYSFDIPFETDVYGNSNKIKIAFQHNVTPTYFVPWVRLGWSLKVNYLTTEYTWLNANTPFGPLFSGDEEIINEIYVEKGQFNKFNTVELTFPAPPEASIVGSITISFFAHNHIGRDYADLTALGAALGIDMEVGKRVIARDNGGDLVRFYELEASDDATSSPDSIRVADYVSSGSPSPNAKVWKLKGSYQLFNYGLIDKIMIDSVKIGYLPFNALTSRNYSPPEEAFYELETNEFVNNDFTEEFELGDLIDISNGKNLYRGWLRYADGTPTETWYRDGIDEEVKVLNIALRDRAVQLKDPVERIEANLSPKNVFFSFVNCVAYDSNRYLLTRYSLDDLNCNVTVTLDKMTTGEGGEPPANLGEYSDLEYSNTEYKVS